MSKKKAPDIEILQQKMPLGICAAPSLGPLVILPNVIKLKREAGSIEIPPSNEINFRINIPT